ncbi:hypothetical protein LEP1GSC005_4185 [Leptospira santarosai str. ST188]|nr:hypothetical protein LEP1GSC005_4185 [Leptospira santarosai str. ST188]
MNSFLKRNATTLNPAQNIFLSIIRKLFFQPGSGRRDTALFRGLGDSKNKRIVEQIIKLLLSEKIISQHKGDSGIVYNPNRDQSKRMKTIFNQLTLSDDKIWKDITHYGESVT